MLEKDHWRVNKTPKCLKNKTTEKRLSNTFFSSAKSEDIVNLINNWKIDYVVNHLDKCKNLDISVVECIMKNWYSLDFVNNNISSFDERIHQQIAVMSINQGHNFSFINNVEKFKLNPLVLLFLFEKIAFLKNDYDFAYLNSLNPDFLKWLNSHFENKNLLRDRILRREYLLNHKWELKELGINTSSLRYHPGNSMGNATPGDPEWTKNRYRSQNFLWKDTGEKQSYFRAILGDD